MPVGPLCYTVHADSYLRIEKPKKHVAYGRKCQLSYVATLDCSDAWKHDFIHIQHYNP